MAALRFIANFIASVVIGAAVLGLLVLGAALVLLVVVYALDYGLVLIAIPTTILVFYGIGRCFCVASKSRTTWFGRG